MDVAVGKVPERQPLYRQVQSILLERILSGAYPEGFFLPNEYELSQEFRVSIGTVRKAVESLMEHRMVLRQQGRGTLVTYRAKPAGQVFLEQFLDPYGHGSGDWIGEMLFDGEVKATGEIACQFPCAEDSPLHRSVQRLAWNPCWTLYAESFSLIAGPESASRAALSVAPSGPARITETVKETVALVEPGADVASVLGCAAGAKALLVMSRRSDRWGSPLEFRRIWAVGGEGSFWIPRQDR